MNKQTGQQYKITALYERLSSDDELQGDSNSIIHQKEILEEFAVNNGFKNCKHYVDDGFSGTNFSRPDFQRMISDIENNMIDTVIVKDLSRFGRSYIDVGYYTEKFFVEHDIRFISITDNVDSMKGVNEFVPFHNLMNDFYAKDIAKKQRAVIQSKGNAGKRLTNKAIYGYKKDDDGQWIIDDEAAEVVKKIFQLCIDGYGVQMIANYLFAKQIKNPSAYTGKIRSNGIADKNPYLWSAQTVSGILSRQEYCGDTVNFKSHRKGLCSKIVIRNNPEDYKIFPDTHEAIISREDFEKVQEIRNKRKRISPINDPVMFQEIFCADCGSRMHIMRSRNFKKTKPDCYICALSRKSSDCSSHYIRESNLVDYVLAEINSLLRAAKSESFKKKITEIFNKRSSEERLMNKKNLVKNQKRIDEIDKILKELYEDKVAKNISLEIFQKLSSQFSAEQKELMDLVVHDNQKCADFEKTKSALKGFFDTVDNYSDVTFIEKLTPDIVNDFIDRIEIFEAKKNVDSKRQQQVNIYFRGIGIIDFQILP